ncbi:MAG TPA: hypothetical protein VFY61_16835 [Pyrinomonadaceae bacterium]|nr:hypothetical protein [Pyrinomonadaceae bacterium]
MLSHTITSKYTVALLVVVAAFVSGACAALQPPDADGPRSNMPPYPIGLADPAARLEEASVAWYQLSQHYGLADRTVANLNPFTGTIESLPANAGPIVLPKVGAEPEQTEEQVRESLRRFINGWRPLIGAEPNQLSLVERTDEASGIRLARYEQRPFRYPLRGEFGKLVIRFRPDRQVVSISSNCIPNADRLQASIAGLTPKINADQAVDHVRRQPVVVTDASGRQQTFTIPANAGLTARELVVYARSGKDQSNGLQLYLAWEIQVSNGPMKTIYLDAISNQVLAVA